MLKTLIVDDERLVREEMRRIVDWSRYGIELVGEAENGRRALECLAAGPVDLMFTDLGMPGLSGIEFLRAVRDRFPRVRIVVMTMYQDFDLVQQALRLGAVDYITKTRIEKDNFGELLGDILRRLASLPGEECCAANEVRVAVREKEVAPVPGAKRLDKGLWLLPDGADAGKDLLVLEITGTFAQPFRQIAARTRELLDTRVFYLHEPGVSAYALPMKDGAATAPPGVRDRLVAGLRGAGWLRDDALYDEVMARVPSLGMTREELTVFLFQPYITCARALGMTMDGYFEQTRGFFWWHEWHAWLDSLRERAQSALWPEYTEQNALRAAVRYINENYMRELPLERLLQMTAMSKSRFSLAFKNMTGKTFVNYLTDARLLRAKELLHGTSVPIGEVAERVGYLDDRYFRRVFHKAVGVTPGEYRRARRDGGAEQP